MLLDVRYEQERARGEHKLPVRLPTIGEVPPPDFCARLTEAGSTAAVIAEIKARVAEFSVPDGRCDPLLAQIEYFMEHDSLAASEKTAEERPG